MQRCSIKELDSLCCGGNYVLIGSVTFYSSVLKKHEDKITGQPAIAKTNNNVPAGKYKAKLTLADGSTIILDSAGNGKLADHAGITITNQNGQLVYKQNGGALNGSQYNTLSTAKGETFVTQLADGTLAWLNAGSSIHYPVSFTGSERVVEVTG